MKVKTLVLVSRMFGRHSNTGLEISSEVFPIIDFSSSLAKGVEILVRHTDRMGLVPAGLLSAVMRLEGP
jgi:hypothetical protein